jgi:hypothetical protein
VSQINPIQELRDLVQLRMTEAAADTEDGLSPKARRMLSELFGKVIDRLRDLDAALDKLTWRCEHIEEGPQGSRLPKA